MKTQKQQKILEITGKQILIVLIIASLALTIVFNIGVYVGKKKVINAELEAEQKNMPTIAISDNENKQTLKQPEVKLDQRLKEAKQIPAAASPSENAEQKTQTSAEIKEQKNEKSIQAFEKSLSKKPLTEITKYTIKIGTFNSKENASKMVNLLKSSGYKPWLKSESGSGKQVYDVFVGEFSNIGEAREFGKSLQEKSSYITGYLIRGIQK